MGEVTKRTSNKNNRLRVGLGQVLLMHTLEVVVFYVGVD